jgi:hypothetical protein
MDPITAVGLAANIFSFIDFAGKLFTLGKEIQQGGASKKNLDLEVIVDDITALSLKLKDGTIPFVGSTRLSEDDQVPKLFLGLQILTHALSGFAHPCNRMYTYRRRTVPPTSEP